MSLREHQLDELLDMIDWYRRCLEDIVHRVPVRGLDEAKRGYDAAYEELRRRAKQGEGHA